VVSPRLLKNKRAPSGTDTSFQRCRRRRVLRTDVRNHSPSTDIGKRGDGERDSIVNGFGDLGRRETYLSRRLSGKWIGSRTGHERRTRHLLRREPLVCAARFARKGDASPENFSTFLNSFRTVIKAETVARVWVGSEAICQPCRSRIRYYCNFCGLESNLSREFCVAGRS